ncbi:MAG: hypothetical protein H0W64_07430 [Gammaproteobacteria bacterium]|nr:hypothetical protein [Gammaproteobacteria bacterium]
MTIKVLAIGYLTQIKLLPEVQHEPLASIIALLEGNITQSDDIKSLTTAFQAANQRIQDLKNPTQENVLTQSWCQAFLNVAPTFENIFGNNNTPFLSATDLNHSLTKLADVLIEEPGYDSITKIIAEQILSRIKLIVKHDPELAMTLHETASMHGLFSRTKQIDNNSMVRGSGYTLLKENKPALSIPDINNNKKQQFVLWDSDGPLNNIYLLMKSSEQKPLSGFFYNTTPSVTTGLYINNIELVKATLQILHQNNVPSLLASQRITYGYGKEKIIEAIDNILEDKTIAVHEAWDQMLKHELIVQTEDVSPKEVVELLNSIAANPQRIPLTENEKILLRHTKDLLTTALVDEKLLRTEMFKGYDAAFGEHRPFLKQTDAEIMGKNIAYSGQETGNTKWGFIVAAKSTLPDYEKLEGILVDDNISYKTKEKNFQQGNFVHAPRDKEDITDNLYLTEVLLKTVSLKTLIQDVKLYPELALLLVLAHGNSLAQIKEIELNRGPEELTKMVRDFIKSIPAFLENFLNLYPEGNYTFLSKSPIMASYLQLTVLSAYGKQLSDSKQLNIQSKRSFFQTKALGFISSSSHIIFIEGLVNSLKIDKPDDRFKFLCQENDNANKYEKTSSWSTIITAAQNRALQIAQLQSPLSNSDDTRIKNILSITADRWAVFNYSKTNPLERYKALKKSGAVQVQEAKPLLKP